MGELTPGAKYIYERVGETVYAREFGSTTRREVGRDYNLHDRIMEDKLWGDIRRAAKDNPALHEALERAILIYHLSKDKPNE